jgi:hypothetical protein
VRNKNTLELFNKKKIFFYFSFFILFLHSFLCGCIQESYVDYEEDELIYLSYENVNESLNLAKKWLISNLKDEGYFNYIYDPEKMEYPDMNNMIRQFMASRLLAEMSREDNNLRGVHKKNFEYVFDNWYLEKDDIGYIYFDNISNLGAISMALRAIVYSPFYEDYQLKAYKLANCILDLQNDNGSFNAWYIEPDYFYDEDYLLTFYSGESILGLVELYLKTNDTRYLNASIKSQNYYIKKYVKEIEEYYSPTFVPWHTISLAKIYEIKLNSSYVEAIISLNDKLIEIQDDDNVSVLGRFYDPDYPEYGSPHSSSDGVYTEGLAYAYEIAKLTNDSYHIDSYRIGIILGVHNLINLQYDSKDEKINGAIKYSIGDNRIRVDSTQHAIDALNKVLEVFSKYNNSKWNFIYNFKTGEIIELDYDDRAYLDDFVWYALTAGTIISIGLLFVVYLIIRFKKRKI